MLRAITLKAIAKLTLLNPLVHTFFAPYARLSSELVASIPERILYALLYSSLFHRKLVKLKYGKTGTFLRTVSH
jgi:hypothetical protein